MKKRFVLLVLAVLLVLGLVTAAAADSSNESTEGAYLAFRQAEWDNSAQKWYMSEDPDVLRSANLPLDSNHIGQFVYYNGKTTMVIDPDKLTWDTAVSVESFADSGTDEIPNIVKLSVKTCKGGSVSYTAGDQKYSFSVTGTLPNVAFYSTTEATESAYLTEFGLTTSDKSFYLVPRAGFTLTKVTVRDSFADITTVEQVADKTGVWKITITDDPTDTWLSLSCTLNTIQENEGSWTYYCNIQISDLRPGLRFRKAEWSGETEGWTMPGTAQQFRATNLSLDSNYIGQFVYYNGQTETVIDSDDLEWDEAVSVESFDYDGADKIRHAVMLSVKTCKGGSVSYTTGDQKYSFSVTGTLPDVAFYSTTEATESAYLTEFDLTTSDYTFYLVPRNGYTLTEVTPLETFASVTRLDGDTEVWKITSTGDLTNTYLNLNCKGQYNSGNSWQCGYNIRINDLRPGLFVRDVTSRNNELLVDETVRTWSQLLWSKGFNRWVCLYYGTRDNYQAVDSVSVDKPEILSVTQKKLSDGTTYYELDCKALGEAKLTYKVGNQTYTQTVSITMTDPWFFTAQSRDEAHYCASGIAVNELTDNAVWVIKEGGFAENELPSLKVELDNEPYQEYVLVKREDGNYDLKVTLPDIEPDEMRHLQISGNGFGIGDSVYFNMDGQAAYVEDYVIGWSWTDDGIVRINEGNWQMGAGSIDVDDSYSEFRTLQIAAGTKKTDEQDNVYYELVDSDKVGLTVKKLWLEVLYGEKDCFSLSDTAFVEEQTTGFGADITIYSKAGNRGGIRLWAEVAITVNGKTTTEKVSVTCTSRRTGYYTESRKQGDTVDKLNAYLKQLVENGLEKDAIYEITLANQEYKGTIVIPEEFQAGKDGVNLSLRGSTSEDGTAATIIHGAIDLNGATVSDLQDLHFKATETCNTAIYGGSLLNMSCCSFEGYKIAADATAGCVTLTNGNVFVDNEIAVHVDLANSGLGMNQSSWKNNTFIGNGIAVQIESLHSFISAYYLRILDSNFIGNKLDFDMQCEGTLYMYRNYFCQAEELTHALIQNLHSARTEALVNSYLTYSKPTIQCINGYRVITNPRWLLPVLGWWRCGADISKVFPADNTAAAAVALEDDYENKLVSDWELDTWILNEDADDLILDEAAFDETGEKEIEVLDKEENSLGTWSFDGED